MPNLPHQGEGSEGKRIAVIVRIPKSLDHEIEIACDGMGWKKQHFFEVASRDLLTKLTRKPRQRPGGAA
jgi:DnaJ-class molecular chaperone